MSRDFVAEFEAFVAERMPDGDFVGPVLAAELVEELRRTDPRLLTGWLAARAEVILADWIGTRDRAQRAKAARERPAAEFASAADRFAAGDSTAMGIFAERLVVTEENLRRQIGDMTKADHIFVADQHVKRAEAARFEAAFHRAIAKRIPAGKTTRDVLSEEDYKRLRESLRPGKTVSAA